MKHTITANIEGERLDQLLARSFPDYSRSVLQKLCKQGNVVCNGQVVTDPSHKPKLGQKIDVTLPSAKPHTKPDIEILHEDTDVLVLNKPAGLLTHAKGALADEPTLADFIRPHTTAGADTNRPGIVHRLDRGTSGVIIAAKTPSAQAWLQKQFAKRNVKKTYIALVAGHPKEPAAEVDLPIERNPKKPQTFRVGPNGKPAQTMYQTEHAYKGYTLLRMKPLTGRTHQLRVHAAYLGCPIVGDHLYGKAEPKLDRMFLHAAELEITLPSSQRVVFTAPLPPELARFLETLHD